jgi:hypothetical protein
VGYSWLKILQPLVDWIASSESCRCEVCGGLEIPLRDCWDRAGIEQGIEQGLGRDRAGIRQGSGGDRAGIGKGSRDRTGIGQGLGRDRAGIVEQNLTIPF